MAQRAMTNLPVTIVRPSIVGPPAMRGVSEAADRGRGEQARFLLLLRLYLTHGWRWRPDAGPRWSTSSWQTSSRTRRWRSCPPAGRRPLVPSRRRPARGDAARGRRARELYVPGSAAGLRAAAAPAHRAALSRGDERGRCSTVPRPTSRTSRPHTGRHHRLAPRAHDPRLTSRARSRPSTRCSHASSTRPPSRRPCLVRRFARAHRRAPTPTHARRRASAQPALP